MDKMALRFRVRKSPLTLILPPKHHTRLSVTEIRNGFEQQTCYMDLGFWWGFTVGWLIQVETFSRGLTDGLQITQS
jgi:hypothetical protein